VLCSKFESSNKCNQVEGCVDPDVIAQKFRNHFKKSYTANNVRRGKELKEEHYVMRDKHCGSPDSDISHVDTEMISRFIIDMKRGKEADIDGLTVEHLQHSHSVASVLLSKLFRLILLTRRIPSGFQRSYVVPISLPKIKHCRTKAMTCDDFRGIAISPILSKVFEHCLLKQLLSITKSENSQFGFKKGVSCSHAIYTIRNIVDRRVSQGFAANLCAIDL